MYLIFSSSFPHNHGLWHPSITFYLCIQRLSEPKLKSFYSDLKLHDKEEIAYKHFIATGNSDKDGLKEAELRKKLIGKILMELERLCKYETPLYG